METARRDDVVYERFVNFELLLAKAMAEGRVNGKYRCPVCGMRYRRKKESQNCCARPSPREERRGRKKRDWTA